MSDSWSNPFSGSIHTTCVQTAKALAGLHGCPGRFAVASEPFAFHISAHVLVHIICNKWNFKLLQMRERERERESERE